MSHSKIRIAVVVFVVAVLGMVYAAVASAEPSQSTNSNGKKSCTLSTGNGFTIQIDDGQKLTITTKTTKQTFTCKDGKLVEDLVISPTTTGATVTGTSLTAVR